MARPIYEAEVSKPGGDKCLGMIDRVSRMLTHFPESECKLSTSDPCSRPIDRGRALTAASTRDSQGGPYPRRLIRPRRHIVSLRPED